MKTTKESKAVTEVRHIRQQLQREARRVGRKAYHAMLNRKRGWFIGRAPSVVRERSSTKYKAR
jgi:hypothetical protein